METCQYCGKQGKSVKYHIWRMHGEGQKHNPNTNRVAWNKGKTKETDDRIRLNGESIKKSKQGMEPTGCCAWDKETRSIEAKRQGFGGYRENAGHSKKFKVVDSYGKETTLQSTYELQCSELLNELGIAWLRPKALHYGGRKYFADFYLPAYDVYLDPKNAYKAKQDKQKISSVIEENNVKLFVLLKEQITKEFILNLCHVS